MDGMRAATIAAAATLALALTPSARAVPPRCASTVVRYVAGSGAGTSYQNPAAALGEPARQIPVAGDEHRDAWQSAREHQRFISRAVEVGQESLAVAHHRHAVRRPRPRIAACQDGRAVAGILEQTCEVRHERRLPAAADRHVADADDRPVQSAPAVRAARVPPASFTGDGGV